MLKFYMHHKYLGKCLKLLFKQSEEKNAFKPTDQMILTVYYNYITLFVFIIRFTKK